MKKSLIALCVAGALSGLYSCGTVSSIDALDGEWKIVEIGGRSLTQGENPSEAFIGLSVKDNRLYGSTSCNRLLGSFEADAKKGTLRFGQAGSTRMACPDMEAERQVLDAINNTAAFEIQKDGSMLLKNSNGKTVMKVEKK